MYYGAGTWVAVGQDATYTILYSRDGTTWTGIVGSKTLFSDGAYAVSYGNNLWVATGYVTSIAYSSDAVTWTGISTLYYIGGYGVAYGNNMWMTVGDPNSSYSSVLYSTNGIAWTNGGSTRPNGRGIAYSAYQNLWVAGGISTPTIATSPDGITWTGRGSVLTGVNGVAYSVSKNYWVAVGANTTGNTIIYSKNGIDWTGSTGSGAIIATGRGVSYYSTNNVWITVGAKGTHTMAYSNDAITWTGITITGATTLLAIANNINYSDRGLIIAMPGCVAAFSVNNYNASTGVWTNDASSNAVFASSYTFSGTGTGYPTISAITASQSNNSKAFNAVTGVIAQMSTMTFFSTAQPTFRGFFILSRYTGSTNCSQIFGGGFYGHFNSSYYGVFSPDGGTWISPQSIPSGLTITNFVLTVGYVDSTSHYWVYRCNGKSLTSSATVTNATSSCPSFAISPLKNNDYQIVEFFTFNTEISASTALYIENYFLNTYGITKLV